MSLVAKLRASAASRTLTFSVEHSNTTSTSTSTALVLSSAPNTAPAATWQDGPSTTRKFEMPHSRPPVDNSAELDRILALPRRPPVDLEKDANGQYSPKAQALVQLMTERLGRGPRKCACKGRHIDTLMPVQAWALYEAPLAGGLFGAVGVGSGKTTLDILMAMVMPDCKRAVLLIPPGLRHQLKDEYLLLREHFRVPSIVFEDQSFSVTGAPVVYVVPYSKLSQPKSTALFKSLDPDCVLADEIHRLKNRNASSVSRWLRHHADRPDTRLCGWSGTVTTKGIEDYAHLLAISLGDGSPLPINPQVVQEWAGAVDPSEYPGPPGALQRLSAPGETLYQGYHRRLVDTRGVVTTKSRAVDASINIFERNPPPMPKALASMLEELRSTEERPDGEELVDQLAVATCAQQLACGFYYRFHYPRHEKVATIEAWFRARKNWGKELRAKLLFHEEHLDSPHLCANAAARAGTGYTGDLPIWSSDTWAEWAAIKDSVKPETEAVWVDDYLARDAAEWGKKHLGIIWYAYGAFGQKVAELGKLTRHGGGLGAEARILAEKGNRTIVASIKAHGTGRDGLQRIYREQLVANAPSSGGLWEQLLGRLNRLGQTADEIDTWVYRHTAEMASSIDRAVIQAKYIQGTLENQQLLLYATCDFKLEE